MRRRTSAGWPGPGCLGSSGPRRGRPRTPADRGCSGMDKMASRLKHGRLDAAAVLRRRRPPARRPQSREVPGAAALVVARSRPVGKFTGTASALRCSGRPQGPDVAASVGAGRGARASWGGSPTSGNLTRRQCGATVRAGLR